MTQLFLLSSVSMSNLLAVESCVVRDCLAVNSIMQKVQEPEEIERLLETVTSWIKEREKNPKKIQRLKLSETNPQNKNITEATLKNLDLVFTDIDNEIKKFEEYRINYYYSWVRWLVKPICVTITFLLRLKMPWIKIIKYAKSWVIDRVFEKK